MYHVMEEWFVLGTRYRPSSFMCSVVESRYADKIGLVFFCILMKLK